MSDRPTPETKEAWDAVSRLPSGMYDSRVSIRAYATAMSDHSRKMERQRDELLDELTIIRTVASYPHHPNALHAIQSISKNAIAAVKGGEG